jgi:hypothetical protein
MPPWLDDHKRLRQLLLRVQVQHSFKLGMDDIQG